ncbi:MAG: hypothetical protein KA712_09275 [Myxococcales bacterium]|nr:hypothetical protein [Myxococcales bacterium]
MGFDIAAGLDNGTLNTLIAQVYAAVYPSLFRDTIQVNEAGISSVSFDINQAPTALLTLSEADREQLEKAYKKALAVHASATSAESLAAKTVAAATTATLGLQASSVALTVNYTGGGTPTQVTASLAATVSIDAAVVSGNNVLTVQVVTAALNIPGQSALQALLNEGFVPGFLIPYLNQNILSPIQIPALAYGSLQVSMPVPVVNAPYVTAYSALGATPPDVPPPSTWPTGCVYVATDVAALTAAASIPFPIGPSTGFDWKIISGEARAQVLPPQGITINADGSLTATAVANASAQLTVHTPWPLPNFSFGPSATASLTATLQPSVVNGELVVQVAGIVLPSFSFSWGSIPDWVEWILSPLLDGLADALNAVFGPLIKDALSGLSIPVYTIPSISIPLAGKEISVHVNQATTSATAGNSLLLVQAKASVSSTEAAVAKVLARSAA